MNFGIFLGVLVSGFVVFVLVLLLVDSMEDRRQGQERLIHEPPPLAKAGQVEKMLDTREIP